MKAVHVYVHVHVYSACTVYVHVHVYSACTCTCTCTCTYCTCIHVQYINKSKFKVLSTNKRPVGELRSLGKSSYCATKMCVLLEWCN